MSFKEKLFAANPIETHYCELHHVEVSDAEFIYNLRKFRKDNFLKETKGEVSDQEEYIKKYFNLFNDRKEIYYKVFDKKEKEYCGILRLTEIDNGDVFNWQSAIFKEDTSPNIFIDVMLLIYSLGFDYLEKETCGPWEVKKEFAKMMKIHKMLGMAKAVNENETYYLVAVKKKDYLEKIDKYKKMNFGLLKNKL